MDHEIVLKTCSISMRFDGQSLQHALEMLQSAAGPICAKPECRSCRVESNVGESGKIRYTEEWQSNAAFRRNVRSEDFWRVLLALDLCVEEPEVMIGDLKGVQGMEALRAVRESCEESNGIH